uniref:Craniofacial development protein 2 n=1 Tax=Cacopsylla melanoneura TaxID=428564 RepID=A0A8D9E7D4_9HEMI
MGEECIHLKSGHILYFKGDREGLWGTGFLVNKKWKNAVKMFKSNSDRIVQTLIKIGSVHIRVIQVYAPTSDSSEEEIERFYNKLQDTVNEKYENTRTYLIGDWNCKVGYRKYGEREMGAYGYGKRNDRGERFLEFVSENEMFVINSFFANSDKWTWLSPNGKVKNEIDFAVTKDKNSVNYFEVLNIPNIGSDHRCIRLKVALKKRELRRQKFLKVGKIEGENLRIHEEKYTTELETNLSHSVKSGQGLESDYKEMNNTC